MNTKSLNEKRTNEKAVVTVIGKDMVGILAKTSTQCANAGGNVLEVSQSVMDGFFSMIMIIEISEMTISLKELENNIANDLPHMQVLVMHENIFQSMHRI